MLIQERSQEDGGDINPWGITFQTMFHMSNDAGFFRTPAQMETDGWRRDGVDWVRETAAGTERSVPLYEAKMTHHFDHRWATYSAGASDDEEGARDCTLAEKQNPDFEPSPRYWVPEDEVILRAARVPSALKSAVKQARGEGGTGRRKAAADAQVSARSAALKALVTWLAGAVPALEGRPAREADIFRLLGRGQDWRGALKVSPERFLLDPKTLVAGTEMQCETPLTGADLTVLAEGPEDVLALAELLIAAKQPRWLMGWRDITNATNERTVIGTAFPKMGVGNNLPIWYPGPRINGKLSAVFVGMLSCMIFDFSARHKVGGTHLNFFIAQQLPVLPPSVFSSDDLSFVSPRVLELTYTSHAMKPWAEDLGYSGPPFAWNEDRRAQLRAELDIFFARKYGLTEEEQRYVLDPAKVKGADYPSETFRVLKEKEIRLYGEYRTERLVLEAWKRMEAERSSDALPVPIELPPLEDVSDGAWAWTHGLDERDRVRAQLRAMVAILPGAADARRVRLATLACLNPRLLGDFLSSSDLAEWQRVVGQQARPNEGVATMTPPTNAAWGAAYNELVSAAVLDVSADGSEWSAGPRLDRSTLHVGDPAVGRALFAWSRLQSVDLALGLTQVTAEIIPFIREGRLAA